MVFRYAMVLLVNVIEKSSQGSLRWLALVCCELDN
jgi:hypothetical protein